MRKKGVVVGKKGAKGDVVQDMDERDPAIFDFAVELYYCDRLPIRTVAIHLQKLIKGMDIMVSIRSVDVEQIVLCPDGSRSTIKAVDAIRAFVAGEPQGAGCKFEPEIKIWAWKYADDGVKIAKSIKRVLSKISDGVVISIC